MNLQIIRSVFQGIAKTGILFSSSKRWHAVMQLDKLLNTDSLQIRNLLKANRHYSAYFS